MERKEVKIKTYLIIFTASLIASSILMSVNFLCRYICLIGFTILNLVGDTSFFFEPILFVGSIILFLISIISLVQIIRYLHF